MTFDKYMDFQNTLSELNTIGEELRAKAAQLNSIGLSKLADDHSRWADRGRLDHGQLPTRTTRYGGN